VINSSSGSGESFTLFAVSTFITDCAVNLFKVGLCDLHMHIRFLSFGLAFDFESESVYASSIPSAYYFV
jgi:hypothetical protein